MAVISGTSNGTGVHTEPPKKTIVSKSPATGRLVGEVEITPLDAIPTMMERAKTAQRDWFRAGLDHRLKVLRNLKSAMQRNIDRVVATMVAEQGKIPFEALCEYWNGIACVAFFCGHAAKALAPKPVMIPIVFYRRHWIERRPFGVVLTIAPWNFPVLLSIAPIAAALVAGNAVIYKPSEFATQTGEALARMIHEAGVPEGVFQIAHGAGDVGAALVKAKPDKISFTGSVATGRKIAAAAGELLIPCTLELGAKDAALVLEDADLDRAARGVVWGALLNGGQACLSVEQVHVARSIADKFIASMKKVIETEVRVGPGEAMNTTMGAIVTPAQVNIIDTQVRDAVDHGAQVVMGGQKITDTNGQFYQPTILMDVTPDMRLMKDETFGPIIPVIPFDNEAEAIERINASPYGLTGSVWTRNLGRGVEVARKLDAGHASVNDHVVSASLPNLPWGGLKDSGYGSTRGVEGILEMTRPQSFSAEWLTSLPSEYFWYPYTPFKYDLLRRFMRVLYAPTLLEKIRILLGR